MRRLSIALATTAILLFAGAACTEKNAAIADSAVNDNSASGSTPLQVKVTQNAAGTTTNQRLLIAYWGERLAALEERVLGLEHPLDSLMERTEALEREVFGGTADFYANGGTQTLPERIGRLESSVYKNAAARQDLPDGMSTFVENRHPKPIARTISQKPSIADKNTSSASLPVAIPKGYKASSGVGNKSTSNEAKPITFK